MANQMFNHAGQVFICDTRLIILRNCQKVGDENKSQFTFGVKSKYYAVINHKYNAQF